jgi:hypothetical protein
MPIKNTATTVEIIAWNTNTQLGQTGDSANITVRGVGDGVEFTPSVPAITEIDAINLKGIYSIALTTAENNYDQVTIGGISTSTNVVIIPFSWANEQIDFNTTQKASINTEADTALSDIKLDHLVAVAESSDVVNSSIIAKLASKSATPAWNSYNNTTDSLEAKADDTGSGLTAIPTITAVTNVTTVATVTNDVGITQTGADKVWGTTARSLTDKVDFALSTAGIKAIWDQAINVLTTVGSIGKKITDWVLGTDSKVILSSNAQTGVTIPTVTTVTNPVTVTSNADITAILADTNELQGLISSSKIAAQVKGMDADVITASALKTDAVTEITAAIWAKIVDGTITFEKFTKIMLAIRAGTYTISGTTITYKDQSGATILVDAITDTGGTPVIS